MPLLSQAKQATDVVLGIPNGDCAFPLAMQVVVNELRERWERLLVVFRQAMLGISTVQCRCQDSNGRLDIFPGRWMQGGSKLVIQLCERHASVLAQNFLWSIVNRREQLYDILYFLQSVCLKDWIVKGTE
jgi:hypothetical protein